MAKPWTCHDCGRPTTGTELSPGAKSALCADCAKARKEGRLPAHVTKDAAKLATPRKKKRASAG